MPGGTSLTSRETSQNQPKQSGANSEQSTKQEDPTLIQEGVMTDKQRKHSRIFKGFIYVTGGRKLRDLIGNQNEIHVEKEIGDVQAPRGPDLRMYLQTYFKKVICGADAIVIGTTVSKSSQLTDDGTFTFTDFEFSPEDVLKANSSVLLGVGNSITITRPGGSVKLNGRIIRGQDHNNEPLQVGRRYLLFLRLIPDTGAFQALDNSAFEDSFELNAERITQVSAKALPFGNQRPSDAVTFLSELRSAITGACS